MNWCEYRINGELSNFVGRVVLNEEYADKEFDDTWVKIYCDNQVVYESPLVTKGMEPSDFDINLSGVQNLRIEISGKNAVRMVDCYVNK